MLNSLFIAFAMYSKIPMPRVEWNEKNMSYSMCFFPFVGAVTGCCEILCFYLCSVLSAGRVMTAAFMTALPILINGGIHMDGFLDTIDAKSSWKPKEERLKILKDPHAGAFAMIYGILYLMLSFSLYYELTAEGLKLLCVGYAFERTLSGLSVVTFKKAKSDGTASAFAAAAEKKVKWILAAESLLCMAGMLFLNPLGGGLCILTGILCFVYYRQMAYKFFGGITGDLAGYFLQTCEFMLLLVLVLTEKTILLF